MNTKEKILIEALNMFSDSGYNAVSIRDIAGMVNIKESSIYYHFKNKQDILDSLIVKYEDHIRALVKLLQESTKDLRSETALSADTVNAYYFEQYLFDPFCNKMMRFMMLEQFHDDKIAELYEYYLFELPYKYQLDFLMALVKIGILEKRTAKQIGESYFSTITMLTFKYLLCGKFTEEKKSAFLNEASEFMKDIFGR